MLYLRDIQYTDAGTEKRNVPSPTMAQTKAPLLGIPLSRASFAPMAAPPNQPTSVIC